VRSIITGIAAALVGFAPVAHADPTTDEVCGAFNLGVPPDQIAERLGQNDGRYNYWTAQRDTVWPITTGQCGDQN
jgi:hypothetical protein